MPIDPNISLQVNNDVLPQPLGLLGQVERLREEKNKNLLFQQQNDARMAAGEIYRNSLLPGGDFDYEKFVRDISSNPATNIMAGQFIQEAQQRLKGQNELKTQDVALLRTHLTLLGDGLGSLALLGDDVTKADLLDVASKLVTSLPGDKKFYANVLRQIKDAPEGGTQLAQWIQKQQLQMAPFKERMDLLYPAPQVIDRGGDIELIQTDRMQGSSRRAGTLEKTPTPDTLNAPFEIKNPAGDVIAVVPRSAVMDTVTGRGRPYTSGAPGVGGGAALQPGPASVEQEKKFAEEFATYRTDLDKQIRAGEEMTQNQNSILALAKKANTGGLTERFTTLARIAQGLGVPQEWVDEFQGGLKGGRGDLPAAQAFQKKVFDFAIDRLKAVAPGGWQMPAMELQGSLTAGPNLEMDTNALEMMFNMNNKLLRYRIAEREFMDTAANVPERQRRRAWTEVAKQKGLLNMDDVEVGSTKKPQVPDGIRLEDFRDGQVRTITDGTKRMVIRRRGDKLEVVQ